MDTIEIAAPLCDIGNIAIPREILQKMSDLTKEEAAIARRHPIMGAKVKFFSGIFSHNSQRLIHTEGWTVGTFFSQGTINNDQILLWEQNF